MYQDPMTFLHDVLKMRRTIDVVRVCQILRAVLELGYCPDQLYSAMSGTGIASLSALRKSVSRIAPEIWKRGAGIFHPVNCEYDSPLNTIHDLLYYLSDGKIW